MEFNQLKSTWDAVKTPSISAIEIRNMLSENKHPVLKALRKQLAIEITGWLIFIAVYYSMLDGAVKPLWINLSLIFSILLPFVHNLMGYRLSKNLIYGDNIQKSLRNFLSKVKVYAIVSIVSRQIYLVGLLLFLTYGISLNANKLLFLIIAISCFLIQFAVLSMIWKTRLKSLKKTITAFY
ncbi:hypothetical protein [Sphingobacterium sp. LRF_L2]|uniref:hypothetical protein n=1 Tax=Sphingobacterium sp. LRF_L2 TaxID=3369421 RepID=UPI003F6488C8